MGHEAPAAPEAQAWIPPAAHARIPAAAGIHPLPVRAAPDHAALRSCLGRTRAPGRCWSRSAHDPECADIAALEGQKDTYYYSSQVMSGFFAWVTMLVMEDDLPRTIAEMTRHNCVDVSGADAAGVLHALAVPLWAGAHRRGAPRRCGQDPRYQDIRLFESPGGRMYLYSSDKMSEKYARALSVDMDRGPVD